jgi:hypothetical protein
MVGSADLKGSKWQASRHGKPGAVANVAKVNPALHGKLAKVGLVEPLATPEQKIAATLDAFVTSYIDCLAIKPRTRDLAGGKPVLAMLNSDGSLPEMLTLEAKEKKLESRLIGGWMAKHRLPTRDAQKMLDEALAKAKAEDKKVFFILSASWCGPFRMLARFLAPHKSEVEKHFVFVKLDISRDDHVDELRERFKESADGGVPWYCILDPEAKVLTTSNVPKDNPKYGSSNMGFPSLPAVVEHFVGMLRSTAPGLSAEKLAEYKAELIKKK